jgi:hypothetical protein
MTTAEKVIKNKVGLIKLAEQLGNVSQACKIIGYSCDSFYRFKEMYKEQGEEGLRELSRRKPNPKNRVGPAIEEAVLAIALENPALGQLRVSNTLKQDGIFVSPGGVRSIWLRYELETFKKRLKALEEKAAAENLVLTEAQLQAMEKAKEQREAQGEIETEHPGYLGAQDTYSWVPSKVLDGSTSRPSSIPMPRSGSPSYIPASMLSLLLICSMTGSCPGIKNNPSACYGS